MIKISRFWQSKPSWNILSTLMIKNFQLRWLTSQEKTLCFLLYHVVRIWSKESFLSGGKQLWSLVVYLKQLVHIYRFSHWQFLVSLSCTAISNFWALVCILYGYYHHKIAFLNKYSCFYLCLMFESYGWTSTMCLNCLVQMGELCFV